MVAARDFLRTKEFVAEMLGTFILTLIGKAAAVSLSAVETPGVRGSLGSLAGGLGVMVGIFVTGKSSGAHMNPQVSLAFAVTGDLPWPSLPAYVLAQFLGAGAGAGLVLAIYSDTLTDPALMAMSTYPGVATSLLPLICDQVTASCLLQLVNACVKEQNIQPGGLAVGLSVAALGFSFGPVAGAAMNPAADFMPRLVSYLAGNSAAFSHSHFWLLPFFLPYIGGLTGGLVYKYGIVRLGGRDHGQDALQKKIDKHSVKTII